uniref:Uncharacterized protein n=1 Tax=uncultured SAR11 cluster alpha proteobacterium H17925_45G17 TaxID=715038 RepID=E7CA43_9PROT|nr:hypothetical protein [uncultured SAR11 cluster alpha proteobacterium H17925_45G17]
MRICKACKPRGFLHFFQPVLPGLWLNLLFSYKPRTQTRTQGIGALEGARLSASAQELRVPTGLA